MKDKEKQILEFLRRNGRSSTTRISDAISSNTWMTQKYLDKLKSENKVIKEEETISTYWDLVKKNEI